MQTPRRFQPHSFRATAVALAALVLANPPARAVDGVWDGGGTTAIWGGVNNWNPNSQIADGVGSTVLFGSAFANGYTITLNTARTIGTFTFTDPANANNMILAKHASDYILTLNNSGASPVINVTQSGRTLTLNCQVAGTNGLTKSGPGTLTLGTTNTYSGNTTIGAGTLTVGHLLAMQNSVLDTTASLAGTSTNGFRTTVTTPTLGGLSGNKNLADVFTTSSGGYGGVTDLRLNPGSAVSASYSGSIADGAAGMTLTKLGAGTQSLSGNNTYSGGTINSGASGILVANSATALGTGLYTHNGGRRLVVATGVEVTNAILLAGTGGEAGRGLLEPGSTAGTATISGPIQINSTSGGGGHFAAPTAGTILHVKGVITATLTVFQRVGTVSYSGGGTGYTLLTSGGTIQVGASDGIAPSATVGLGESGAAGILDLNGFNQSLVGITKGANAATVTNSSATTPAVLTLTGSTTTNFAGPIADNGVGKLSLTVNGGHVTLSGVNTYRGATTISAGRLTFSTAGSATTDVAVDGGATNGVLVAASDGQWVNTGSLTNASGSVVDVDYGNTVPGMTTAPIKVNHFSVGAGLTLRVLGIGFSAGQNYPLVTWTGIGPTDTNAFANLVLPASPAVTGHLTISGTTLYLHVDAVAAKSWAAGDGDWDTTTANWLDTDSNLASTYTDLADAVLFNDAAGASGHPTVNLTGAYSPLGVTMRSTSHDYTIAGPGGIGGSGPVILDAANTRTLTLATANSYTGGTTLRGGRLVLSGAGTLGSTAGSLTLGGGQLDLGGWAGSQGAVSITAAAASGETITNGTLSATSYDVSNPGGDAVISASLGGSGALIKSGAGTATLVGANTYSGVTTVTAGELDLGNWGASTLGMVTVGGPAGATLGLSGTATYNVATRMSVGAAAGNGTVNQTGGTVGFTASDCLLIGTGAGSGASGTYNLSGGTLTNYASATRGVMLGVNPTCSGTFTLSGTGNLYIPRSILMIGRSDAAASNCVAFFHQTGGMATVGTLTLGGTGAGNTTSTMSLAAGTFVATNFTKLAMAANDVVAIHIGGTADVTLPAFPTARGAGATATLSFDGGTLRPLSNSPAFMGGMTSAGIKAGGATVNVDGGKSVTITQALLADDVSTGGGLTKAGDGALTLSGTNTYSGATTISAGKLVFSTMGSAATDVTVAGGATNGVLVAGAGVQWVNTGNLTNQDNSVVEVDYGSTLPGTTAAPIKVDHFSVGAALGLRVAGVGFSEGMDYPLVTWTGSGPAGTNAFASLDLPQLDGYLSVSGNTLYLHVTKVLFLSWNTGDGDWDTTTANWVDAALNATNYTDLADLVLFNDAAGASGNPTVNLAGTYAPLGVTMKSTSHDYTIGGPGGIGGGGPVILDAANTRTLTLTATNTYTGGTTIGGGTLQIGGAGRLGNGAYAGAISIATNATLQYSSGAGQTFSGPITGFGALHHNPSVSNMSLVLSSTANTYSGPTTISAGRIQISAVGALSANTPITITGDSSYGGQLFFSAFVPTVPNPITISGVGYPDTGGRGGAVRATGVGQNFTGTITLAGDARIGFIASSSSAMTNSGRITGDHAIDFYAGLNANSVVCTLTLANTGTSNDFTGNASISCVDYSTAKTGGRTILQLGAGDQIPNGAGRGSLVFNGSDANHVTALELNGFNETLNGITNAAAGGAVIQNTAAGDPTLTIGDADTHGAFSGVILDGGAGKTLGLTKIGSGTLALSGPGPLVNGYATASNTFSGNITVHGGTLTATASATTSGNRSALGAANNARTITVNPGATLTFSAPNVLSRTWAQANVPTLVISGGTVGNADPLSSNRCNNALGNVILTNGTLSTSVGHHGGYGGWDINGTVTSSGSSSITSDDPIYATVVLNSAGPGLTPAYTTFDVTDGTLAISAPLVQTTAAGDERVSGLIKTGPGTQILSGANTYTGATTVSNGALWVHGSIGVGAVTVCIGATLGGTGTVNGAVSVEDGGILSPGASAGILALNNGLTLSAASRMDFELGTSSDRIAVTGDLALGGQLRITDSGGFGAGTNILITYTGALTGALPTIESAPGGYAYTVDTNTAGEVRLAVSAAASLTPFQQWQMDYFGSTNAPNADAAFDADGDGSDNGTEYNAGTNPTNTASVFGLLRAVLSGKDVLVTWSAAGVRTNHVQVGTSLKAPNFTDHGAPVILDVPGDVVTNLLDAGGATNAGPRFYRIRVDPPSP